MTASSNRWDDLRPRVISAAVMLAVGGLSIWAGGILFTLLVVVLTGIMLWELASMTAAEAEKAPLPAAQMAVAIGIFGALCLFVALSLGGLVSVILLALPSAALAYTPRRLRGPAALWAFSVMITGFGLVSLRVEAGIPVLIWIVLVVIASDVMGYFAGRVMGGPKFWPAISPKKTWSGTIAGWLGALVVGLGFWAAGYAPFGIVLLSPVISFAGQMGDIAESWIKRRCGVKDSSHLIPGHGGFMDRFDAMTGAVVAVFVLSMLMRLPLPVALGG